MRAADCSAWSCSLSAHQGHAAAVSGGSIMSDMVSLGIDYRFGVFSGGVFSGGVFSGVAVWATAGAGVISSGLGVVGVMVLEWGAWWAFSRLWCCVVWCVVDCVGIWCTSIVGKSVRSFFVFIGAKALRSCSVVCGGVALSAQTQPGRVGSIVVSVSRPQ